MEDIINSLRELNVNEPEIVGSFKDSMGNQNPVYATEVEGDDGTYRLQFINSSLSELCYLLGPIQHEKTKICCTS